jgi:uncharacterized protein (TIGR02996 family)
MTEDAFLRAIAADPEDDDLRLVFADWLDDRAGPGDADRAEFIRVQIERAALPPGDPRHWDLHEREVELLEAHAERWAGELWDEFGTADGPEHMLDAPEPEEGLEPHEAIFDDQVVVFRRGFVDQANMTGDDFRLCRNLLDPHPVRYLTLSAARSALDELAAWLQARRLVALSLWSNDIDGDAVRPLAGSPGLANLAWLNLGMNPLGQVGADAIARSSHLARLRRLRLTDCQLSAAGVAALAASPTLAGLAALHLDSNRIGDEGAAVLARGPAPARPEALFLQDCGIGDAGAQALADCPRFAGLRMLLLHGDNRLTEEGVCAVAASPHLAGLTELYLQPLTWTERAARALAESPTLGRLRLLCVSRRDLSSRGEGLLVDRFGNRLLIE